MMCTRSQPRWNWLETRLGTMDDEHCQTLGAPVKPTGWQHGCAGSVAANRRIDCWLAVSGGQVGAARFEVFASADAARAADWTARWLAGRSVAEVDELTGLRIAEGSGLPDESRTDALCIEDALRAALAAPPIEGG